MEDYPNFANNLFASSCDNQRVFLVTSLHNNNNNKKGHNNNCSGDKQCNSKDAHSSDGYSTQRSPSPITQW
jgi:hypothetical protein